MARLPYVDPSAASADVREVFERLPVVLNIFRMMAHAETSLRPMLSLGMSILARQQLDAKLRELVILRVAKLSPARYEWVQHVPIAEAAGVSAAQITALDRGDVESEAFDERERALLRFATEVLRDVRASDDALAAVTRHFSTREVIEAILTVGYYMMIARLLETTGVDVDPPAGLRIVDPRR